MAMDVFLVCKSEKGLEGESKDKTHKNAIDVLAWSFGASNSGTAHIGGGAGAGKANVQDLSLTKYIDKSSPNLFLFTCNGKHISSMQLIVRKAGETPLEYVVITMDEVMITSYNTGGTGGEDRLTENITLNFAKITFDYTPQDDKGAKGTKVDAKWNIAANATF